MELNQEKIDYINYVYNKEITYWKKAALERVLNESEKKELLDLAPSRILLIHKEKCKHCISYFGEPNWSRLGALQ